jgi:Tol biopolymer transport system component
MLTGETPFEGETVSDQLAALIHKDFERLKGIPQEVEGIVNKCLEKDVSKRFDSTKQLALELKAVRLNLEKRFDSQSEKQLNKTMALPRHNTSENATLIHRTISSDKTASIAAGSNTEFISRDHSRRSPRFGFGFVAILLALISGAAYAGYVWFGDVGGVSYDEIKASRMTDDGNAQMASISSDGKLIAYVDVSGSSSRIMVRQVATGSKVELVPSNGDELVRPEFSPDGNFVYYVAVKSGVGKLFQISSLGGDSKLILEDIDSRPAISPDGESIAFFRHDPSVGGDTMLLADIDGNETKPLVKTSDLGIDKLSDICWTSDGNHIVLSGVSVGGKPMLKTKLIVVSKSDGKVVDLPGFREFEKAGWAQAFAFRTLPDEAGLIFIGRRAADEPKQIWHLDFVSNTTKTVTTDTSDYQSLSVSNDGQTIIASKAEWESGLVSMDTSTKEITQLIPESKRVFGNNGIVETADERLLYSARDGKEVNIYSFDPETGAEKQLTSGAAYNVHPAVSAATGSIVFSSTRNSQFGIWKMDKDGSNPEPLTNVKDGSDVNPVLIDGDKTVVFVRRKNDGGPTYLMKVSIDGGEVSRFLPDSERANHRPTASFDGKRLAWSEVEFDKEALEVKGRINFGKVGGDTVEPGDVKIEISYEDRFVWSPSGNSLIKTKAESGGQLWEISLDGKNEKQITTLQSGEIRSFCWSLDGKRLFIVTGNSSSDLVLIKPEQAG